MYARRSRADRGCDKPRPDCKLNLEIREAAHERDAMRTKPPRRTPRGPTALDEVDHALSTLAGRHPEHEKARRETQAAAERRRTELERELAGKARRRRRRATAATARALAAAAAGVAGWGR